MQFLPILPAIKTPPKLQVLLDIALALALLPHLFILKLPMLLFLLLSIVMLFKSHISKAAVYGFMLLGFISLILSFYAQYNISALSRMLVFVSVIISLLVIAVSLQRLSRTVNFYLIFSPVLLFILAFFFFNTITMLFYALFTLFVFLLLLVWHQMQSPLDEAIRMSATLFALALPVVVLLFLVFPRISFQKTTFGFKSDVIARTGHDGTMYLDSKALLIPSQRIVMEVWFEKQMPRNDQLYFRGSVLYKDKISQWESIPLFKEELPDLSELIEPRQIVSYEITLYPHQRRWLYMLDLPLGFPQKSRIDSNFIVTSEVKIDEIFRYKASSALTYTMLPQSSDIYMYHARLTDKTRDPLTAAAVKAMAMSNLDDRKKAKALVEFFRAQNLIYSLRPEPLDLEHPTDSFLFDTKKGYCVHFAAAFANLARLAGIPSRIVTGYKADHKNGVENYLVIRESDAHAWVELYLEPSGWVRFEPTALAAADDLDAKESVNVLINNTDPNSEISLFQSLWHQSNLYFMYGKYIVEHWILHYSRFKQTALFKELLHNTLFLLKFSAVFLLLTFLSFALVKMLQKKECRDKALCIMKPLLKRLNKLGFAKTPSETMQHFLQSVQRAYPEIGELSEINTLYHQARYAAKGDENMLQSLKIEVDNCIAKSKRI